MQLACTRRSIGQTWQRNRPSKFLGGQRTFMVSPMQLVPTVENNNAEITSSRTRNIGIIAHIDAGKTTTTERMLHYSGHTRRIGSVDEGSTVTDFLPAERARGITIQSAAITIHWPPLPDENDQSQGGEKKLHRSHVINLIDTPGHADFTFEVQRVLRVLDGAVCILDGVAGVESQTEKVWLQSQAYMIPKIIYVNKLDRSGAAFGRTVREIASKLRVWPAVCQIPWFEGGTGRFQGVVDVIELRALKWEETGDGKSILATALTNLESSEYKLVEEARKARFALVELLSDRDECMVEKFLDCNGNHLAISSGDIIASLRRRLLSRGSDIVPVYAGASFRNIGVQPMMDAVISLLPSPEEAPNPEVRAGSFTGGLRDLVSRKQHLPIQSNCPKLSVLASPRRAVTSIVELLEACALAFKVTNDQKRGVLVYIRVYYGQLRKSATLFNTNMQTTERIPRLLRMYASDSVEISSIPAGQIGVITGLKYARTGDTLIGCIGMSLKSGPPPPLNEMQLRPIDIPPPVFFASVEPQSVGEEASVESALALLIREDPSLQLSIGEDSGQRLLSGMGELHLEIAQGRLIHDFKAKATMGRIEVGYREYISAPGVPRTIIFERELAGRFGKAGCVACVQQMPDLNDVIGAFYSTTGLRSTLCRDGNRIDVTIRPQEGQEAHLKNSVPAHLSTELIYSSLQSGALAALSRGPLYHYPLHDTYVAITIDLAKHVFGTGTTFASLSSAARLATEASLKSSIQTKPSGLMEPVMNAVISVDEASLGTVIHDLSASRSGQIVSLDDTDLPARAEKGFRASEAIDIRQVYYPPEPFEVPTSIGIDEHAIGHHHSHLRTITARVPLKEMVGYLKHLRSHTAGRGTFTMTVDRFEKMSSQREKLALNELRGV